MNQKEINYITHKLGYLHSCLELINDELDDPIFHDNSVYIDQLIMESNKLQEEMYELQEKLITMNSIGGK